MSIILVALIALGVIIFARGIKVIPQKHTMVIQRLGRYHRTLQPGLNFTIPFVDQPQPITILSYENGKAKIRNQSKIDQREFVLDFPSQQAVTQDNVGIEVDGVLYYQIMDSERAVYGPDNLVLSIQTLAQTSLRSRVGQMELDKIFESRNEINSDLQKVMDEAGDKWGVKVNRVEIRDVSMPNDIVQAMNKQMTAERTRRAEVREAQGYKEAQIERAEGDRQAMVLKAQGERDAQQALAEGEKQATILKAEGEQQAIDRVVKATGEDPRQAIQYLIAQDYIEMLPSLAKDGDRVFVPMESSSLIGSLGGMRDLLAGIGAIDSANGIDSSAFRDAGGSFSPER